MQCYFLATAIRAFRQRYPDLLQFHRFFLSKYNKTYEMTFYSSRALFSDQDYTIPAKQYYPISHHYFSWVNVFHRMA